MSFFSFVKIVVLGRRLLKWWKITNEEYRDIIKENETPSIDNRSSGGPPINPNSVRPTQEESEQPTAANQSKVGQKLYQLAPEEESNLSAYLNLGMSLTEVRNQFKKEVEVTKMRICIRENARLQQRGSIDATHRTTIGTSTSNRGTGRGGLSFN